MEKTYIVETKDDGLIFVEAETRTAAKKGLRGVISAKISPYYKAYNAYAKAFLSSRCIEDAAKMADKKGYNWAINCPNQWYEALLDLRKAGEIDY